MSEEVTVSGTLSITGEENTYTTLIAENGKRHFDIDSDDGGRRTLTLQYMKMTGGYAPTGSNDDKSGGSIRIKYMYEWDNIVAIALAAQLLLTIVSGMALKLYDLTPGQDSTEWNAFGFVLIIVSVM